MHAIRATCFRSGWACFWTDPCRRYDGARPRLRAWRSQAASSASVPAYVVFTDATLQAIAESRPSSLRELAGLPGIGARKLELYGEDVLAAVSG